MSCTKKVQDRSRHKTLAIETIHSKVECHKLQPSSRILIFSA